MVELPKEEQKLIHVVQLLKLEFDYNPVTGESENQKMTVIKEKKPEVKVAKKADKPLTPEQFLESKSIPCAFLNKSSLRMNKPAAEYMGLIVDGNIINSVIGNRIRIKVGYGRNQETREVYPVLEIDDQENKPKSQQLRDNLSISYSGDNNSQLAQYGIVFLIEKINEDQFKMIGYDNIEQLIGAMSKGGELIPEDATEEPEYNAPDPVVRDMNEVPDPTSPEISGVGVSDDDIMEAIADAAMQTEAGEDIEI